MPEDQPQLVLGQEIAQVHRQPHDRYGCFVTAPFFDGKSSKDDEAFAVQNIVAYFLQQRL